MSPTRALAPIDGVWAGLCGLALALAAAAVIVVPQRLAQRPAAEGVIHLRLAADGRLRLWNRPLASERLGELLAAAAQQPLPPRLRLQPAADVPWGQVRQLLQLLDASGLELELQLP
ncbi:MAG: ExbD/TolR family protein [Prochlorococcaceae cyanobacterium]